MKKAAVIVFPGSNCDRDVKTALEVCGLEAQFVWHQEASLPKVDLVVLPGGFSYGDYLRCGAIAANSNIMQDVKMHAAKGGKLLGICNGFQILCEAGLVDGVLMRNSGLKFICKPVDLIVENAKGYEKGSKISLPVAHHDGNYNISEDGLKALEDNGQIAFYYSENINGSMNNIAGVYNRDKNVLGMMPHPERATDSFCGGIDGKALLASF
jgi:phosphoribosylformylglycinamidine synthase subunit PurQ / glutaminase